MNVYIMCRFILFTICCAFTTTNALVGLRDCFFKEQDAYYDLSILSQQQWEVRIGGTNRTAYISLCGKSTFNSELCPDRNSSVCMVEQAESNFRELVPNLGSRIESKKINNTSLIVSLGDGQPCNISKNYSTIIHFTCNYEKSVELKASLIDCMLTVNWPTIAGCSINDPIITKCVDSTGLINLLPLYRRDSYIINSFNHTFELNICGTLPVGHCGQYNHVTACELDPHTKAPIKVIGMSKKAALKFTEDGLLLLYKAGNVTTKIELICNESIPVGEPRLTAAPSNNSVYTFEFESSFACPLQNTDCTVLYRYDEFDLSALRKETGNWMVKTNDSTFYINICKSLNPVPEAICSDGPIGVCRVYASGESINLGIVSGGPKIENDVLSIKYIGGSKCNNGQRYSSIIQFECSKTSRGPYIINISGCQYTFKWLTPNACPKLIQVGDKCKIYEPRTGIPFKMQELHNQLSDYVVKSENVTFFINLCGSLVVPCNNKTNVSVCMTFQNKSSEIAVGYTSDVLKYFNGRLTFDLKGDECVPGKKSTVTILLECHHHAFVNSSQPELLSFTHSECKFVFIWHTILACKPFEKFDCKIKDNNILYDLSSLSNPSHNHITLSKSHNHSFTYLINVCQPVISGFDQMCETQSGVCQVNNSEADVTKRFINLGDVEKESIEVKNGAVIIKYVYGSMCQADHYSSKIYLFCDKNAYDTNPTFLKESNCQFEFSWRTRAACPVSILNNNNETIEANDNCTIFHSSSGQTFDLIAGLDKTNIIIKDDVNEIMLGICQSVISNLCSAGSGACLLSNVSSINYGNGNSHLEYDTGMYFLNYTGGDLCHNGLQRSTLIKFICVSDDVPLEPHIEINNCNLTVYWFTDSVCKEKINCSVYRNGNVIDLSPLVNNVSYYLAKDTDGKEYFINVCNPIRQATTVKCIPGSSLCATYWQDGIRKEQTLGFPLTQPEIDDNGNIVLKYMKGSLCTNDGLEFSSSIHFKCNSTAGKGQPVFDEIINTCEYKFIWETNVICDETYSRPNVSNSCLVTNPLLNTSVDISILSSTVKVKGLTTSFQISVCNESNLVCASEICKLENQNWLSCGKRKLVEFDNNSNTLKLIYQDETAETLRTAEIWLVCNLTAGTGSPQQINGSDTYPIFEWQTDVVCQLLPNGNWNFSPDSSGISKTGITTVAVVTVVVLCLIIIIIMFLKRNNLRNLIGRWRSGYEYSREIDDNTEL